MSETYPHRGQGAQEEIGEGHRLILNDLLPEEMQELFQGWGLLPYRYRQVLEWIYRHQVDSFQAMTNLSKEDRALLERSARIGRLRLAEEKRSADGTRKWLLELEDGLRIETVLIPEEDHWTQCISTQVGCAMGCTFCRTARMGLKRSLSTWEILEQVSLARRYFTEGRIRNVVLMGMGEPLANYENVVRALRVMLLPEGLGLSRRRITLSTCGLIPEMNRFVQEGLGIKLAVSLNAPTDEIRSRLMPVNRRYPLKGLLSACKGLRLPNRERITFEYILIGGLNDAPHHARMLASLLEGIRCKVNLIPYNPFPGSIHRRPKEGDVLRFQHILISSNYTATIRRSRGTDILAACGQLAGDHANEERALP